jgi:hypothetical protein
MIAPPATAVRGSNVGGMVEDAQKSVRGLLTPSGRFEKEDAAVFYLFCNRFGAFATF